MEIFFVLAFGVMIGVAAYLLMSRSVLRLILGLLVFSNAVNLSIFIAGRLGSNIPPLVAAGETTIAHSANPLPQALILTAIVISFALAAYIVVLFERAYHVLKTVDTDRMRSAEPRSIDDIDKESRE
ncbi:MAG TPA: NADH-quinone oxidoreductase subunit K [Burkholderiaceae bacterium]|nr:NADH-quinone oxidoreductase subunit K [Burkholderiaceae bacterium]